MSRCFSFLTSFAAFLNDLLSFRLHRLFHFARPAPPVSALSSYLCYDDQYSRPDDHAPPYNHAHQKKRRARAGASGSHGSFVNMLTGQGETTAKSRSRRWLLLVLCTHRSKISTASFLNCSREARVGLVLLLSFAFTVARRLLMVKRTSIVYKVRPTQKRTEAVRPTFRLSPTGESVLLHGPSPFTARSTTVLSVRPAFHPNDQALQPAHLARPVRRLEADEGALVGPSGGSSAADAGPISVERGGRNDEA